MVNFHYLAKVIDTPAGVTCDLDGLQIAIETTTFRNTKGEKTSLGSSGVKQLGLVA